MIDERIQQAQDDVLGLLDPSAPDALRARLADAVAELDATRLEAVSRAVAEVLDLEDRTVRDVLGRDGEPVSVHHYRACRTEDAESSWDHRAPDPTIRALRGALMDGLTGPGGLGVEGIEGVAEAVAEGKQLLFVANHESVFDLAVLPHALQAVGLRALSERLTFFVNPKIFNTPFFHFFVCKASGLIKVPQSPRIAANESVMAPDEIRRRAEHGFAAARDRLVQGDSLVIYPEGLRSEGVLHRFARAYLDLVRPRALRDLGLESDRVLLVPWAHRGVRTLEDATATARDVRLCFGRPVEPERFFGVVGSQSLGVAGHLAGFLVARLLPEAQRGIYGADPEAYLGHPHFRLRIREHTLADVHAARRLAELL